MVQSVSDLSSPKYLNTLSQTDYFEKKGFELQTQLQKRALCDGRILDVRNQIFSMFDRYRFN